MDESVAQAPPPCPTLLACQSAAPRPMKQPLPPPLLPPPLVRTPSQSLEEIIGEPPSFEGWLHEDDGETSPGSPHVPSVLEKFLSVRPSADDVVAKGILSHSDIPADAPHIPNELDRFFKARRPSRELVENTGILRSPERQATEELTWRYRKHTLTAHLQRRPTAERLVEMGYLSQEASSAVAADKVVAKHAGAVSYDSTMTSFEAELSAAAVPELA
jgi:hypothetical protein